MLEKYFVRQRMSIRHTQITRDNSILYLPTKPARLHMRYSYIKQKLVSLVKPQIKNIVVIDSYEKAAWTYEDERNVSKEKKRKQHRIKRLESA